MRIVDLGRRAQRRLSLSVRSFFESLWFGERRHALPLLPFAFLFRVVVALRRLLYAVRVLPVTKLPVPVIVVGNLTVGGSGKTPLIIWLSEHLRRHGYKPGIVSRGYGGGKKRRRPQQVRADSNPYAVGDEAVLLAARSACPVAVARKRAQAGLELARYRQCDIILCDDGLQHYALHRDVEIAVIDGERRFGNGYSLPAGPLREPRRRLARCDLLVAKGEALRHEFPMRYRAGPLKSLRDDSVMELQQLQQRPLHAVAGIAYPERFFSTLKQAGLEARQHVFPDHHPYRQADFDFVREGEAILMTEKDAVKCRSLTLPDAWYVPIEAEMTEAFVVRFNNMLQEKIGG